MRRFAISWGVKMSNEKVKANDEKEVKTVHGICSECKEHCEGELDLDDGWTYSDCCGASVYGYEMGEG